MCSFGAVLACRRARVCDVGAIISCFALWEGAAVRFSAQRNAIRTECAFRYIRDPDLTVELETSLCEGGMNQNLLDFVLQLVCTEAELAEHQFYILPNIDFFFFLRQAAAALHTREEVCRWHVHART